MGMLPMALGFPVLPQLLLDACGGNSSRASLVNGVVGASAGVIKALISPVLGKLTDAKGRKCVLQWIFLAAMAEYMVLGLLFRRLWALVLVNLVGSMVGLIFVVTRAMIGDLTAKVTKDTAKARMWGLYGAVVGFVLAVGPLLGGALFNRLGPRFLLWLMFGIAVVNAAVNPLLPLETSVGRPQAEMDWSGASLNPIPDLKILFEKKRLVLLALSLALTNLAEGGFQSVFFLYCSEMFGWGPSEIGIFLSFVGVTLMVSEGLLPGPVVSILGEKFTIITGQAFEMLHFLVFALASSGSFMYLGVIVGIPRFISSPTLRSVIARQVEPDKQGLLQGAVNSLGMLLQPFAPMVASTLFAIFSKKDGIYYPGAPMLAMSVLCSLPIMLTLQAFRRSEEAGLYLRTFT
uniref:Major facilitator superfamily (MFS) profile domain-containing protein n=1 Tax=Compsopogon caeruleus TaxID=31354 RepID=A0A7S1TG90_9RHOD